MSTPVSSGGCATRSSAEPFDVKRFVSLQDPTGQDELQYWLGLRPQDLGAIAATHRIPSASPAIKVLFGLMAFGLVVVLIAAVAAVLAGWLPPLALVFAVLGTLVVAAPVVLLVMIVRTLEPHAQDIEVRRHGLVVDSRPVPFATMDPGRMVWATSASAVRHVVTLNRRRRVAGGECLLLVGTDGPDAVDDWQAAGVGGKYDPLPRAPRLDTPFVWWGLGPKDMPGFVRDLEHAMLADGYPVQGLFAYLAANRWEISGRGEAFARRAPFDPVLWRS